MLGQPRTVLCLSWIGAVALLGAAVFLNPRLNGLWG